MARGGQGYSELKVMVHISTDYVFDGTKQKLLCRDGCSANPQSRCTGKPNWMENLALQSSQPSERHHHQNLVGVFQIRAQFCERPCCAWQKLEDELSVVADQIGSPTNAADLAAAIVTLLPKN